MSIGARINQQGNVVGDPTASQAGYINSPAFKLAVGLYKTALNNGHVFASKRLDEINRALEAVIENDTSLAPTATAR